MQSIYFISDLHIGAGTQIDEEIKLKKFFSFLHHINHKENKLFIIGDLFDFWFEYIHYVPKNHYRVFFELSKLIDNGVEVHFLPGNHDYWFRDFFRDEIGFIIHPEILEIQLQLKKIYIFHGDGVSKKDKGYQILKKIFRNPLNIFLFRLIHPDLGAFLAHRTSHASREYTSKKVLNDEQDYLEFAMDKFKRGFDYVMMGHSHRPQCENINQNCFINLGDWIHHYSYALLSEGQLHLKYWNSNKP